MVTEPGAGHAVNEPHCILAVEVTRRCIEDGIPGSPYHCPVTLAVGANTAGVVCTGNEQLTIAFDNGTAVYNLPRTAQQFVERFDDGQPVHPITFKARMLSWREARP